MWVSCPRCQKVVRVKEEIPNEARCPCCGKVIKDTEKQLEDLILGTLGTHRHG